jgi:hypothetical protein
VLPVYKADGATQAGVGDVLLGQQYVLRFSQGLNSGNGGFFLESPAVSAVVGAGVPWGPPGGRLTTASGAPVNFVTNAAAQTIYYAPYLHPFLPVWNGSTVQMVQFTSSLADIVGLSLAMGGNAAWPVNSAFDLFVTTVSGGAPKLATVQWTNTTTRAVALANFAGFATNGGTTNMLTTGPATIASVPVNQATFLGTFSTIGTSTGTTSWQFGGGASGGLPGILYLCNYYNKCLFNTIVADNGASYTYTSTTIRAARNSGQNAVYFVQSDSERAIIANYITQVGTVAASAGGFCGMGVDTATAMAVRSGIVGTSNIPTSPINTALSFSATGGHFLQAVEAGDGANANFFNQQNSNQLMASLWL